MSNEKNQNDGANVLEEDEVSLSANAERAAGEDSGDKPTDEKQAGAAESAEIEALKDELAQVNEQALRAAAEAQNVRRRAEHDVEKAHKFGLEKFASDMLPVADNLERAIAAATAEGADLHSVSDGVALTLKSLIDALKRHKVEQIDPVGEPFDPERHQAMTMVENPDVEPNSVIDVFQKGYTLNGRLMRPAMVVVAKAKNGK